MALLAIRLTSYCRRQLKGVKLGGGFGDVAAVCLKLVAGESQKADALEMAQPVIKLGMYSLGGGELADRRSVADLCF